MSQLNDRVFVVTGGAGGIGQAITRTLIERGAKVISTDLRELQEPIKGADFLLHDITSERDWDMVIRTVKDWYRRLDGLVNNAGYATLATILETDTEMFRKTHLVNQTGTFFGMKKYAEAMKDEGGVIVNIASCAALRGIPGQFAYAASKWAVRGMTKCAALELAPHNIRVNSINPGVVETPMIAPFSDDQRTAIKNTIPMGRFSEPREIAAAAAFLLSDEASYITGAEIRVDGGVFS